ncbi:hypothetical protein GCM10027020_12510 [Nocardioides salsibiostraticola]
MPTFDNAAEDADEACEALRGLAHATRSMNDPRQIYPVLGSLSSAAASLSQSLHQIASFQDGQTKNGAGVPGSRSERATTYHVSWELHRCAEILRQVAESIDHAHEAESVITYGHRDIPGVADSPCRVADHRVGL